MQPSAASVRQQLLPLETGTQTGQPGPAVGRAADPKGAAKHKREGGVVRKRGQRDNFRGYKKRDRREDKK